MCKFRGLSAKQLKLFGRLLIQWDTRLYNPYINVLAFLIAN